MKAKRARSQAAGMASGTLGPTGCSLQRIYEGQLTDTPRSPTEIVEV